LALQAEFAAAAREFKVPESLLLAVGYDESRWEQHAGQPSTDGGYGMMHLTDLPPTPPVVGSPTPTALATSAQSMHTLATAAAILKVDPSVLRQDPAQNIRGGAALLAQYAHQTVGTTPDDIGDWYGAVALYAGSPQGAVGFADDVYQTLTQGESRQTSSGQVVTLPPTKATPNRITAAGLHVPGLPVPTAECPPDLSCDFVPALYALKDPNNLADYGNYDLANRPADGLTIRYIVIHDTEISYAGALETFQDPRVNDTANYIVRSNDGHVTQLVPVSDVAHHVGNWYVNTHAIGVEHEGFAVAGATWYTETLYRASAKLVRFLAATYHVPLDRAHIIGHDNVPGLTADTQATQHWDPGPYWDWNHYMDLLGATPPGPDAGGSVVTIHPAFATNEPNLTNCNGSTCQAQPVQGANEVELHTAPSASSPLIADSALVALQQSPGEGTTRVDDWGDKAVAGEEFVRVATQGDWDAIDFGGKVAWFYNPKHVNTSSGAGTLIRPKAGQLLVEVYGEAAPEASAYLGGVPPHLAEPIDFIEAGQTYVATDLVSSDFYDAFSYATRASAYPLVRGQQKYYQIFYNHRLGYVKADDVQVVKAG
jgi:hypothetical protein